MRSLTSIEKYHKKSHTLNLARLLAQEENLDMQERVFDDYKKNENTTIIHMAAVAANYAAAGAIVMFVGFYTGDNNISPVRNIMAFVSNTLDYLMPSVTAIIEKEIIPQQINQIRPSGPG